MSEREKPNLEPLRIAMLSIHTSPEAALGGKKTGGMNVYVREVAREMARRGIRVDIFTRVSSPDEIGKISELSPNHRLIYLPCGPIQPLDTTPIFLHLNQFKKELEAFAADENLRYDALYSHYWLSGWVAIQLRQKWGVPVAQMFHTLGHMKNRITDVRSNPDNDIRIRGEGEIIKHADRIIAATPAEYTQLLMLYRADRRKIDIVPPGVDLKRFAPGDSVQARHNIGMDETCKLLLFVGRIEPLKAVDTIFDALVALRTTRPDLLENICICIIGGDPMQADEEMQRLQTLRDMLDLEKQVRFLGAQSQDMLPEFYRASKALIMPSDYESFGMVALEAMACGTPVIASEVGGLAFLVQDGVTGFHVPVREPSALAERIIALLTDDAQQVRMGWAAHETAKNYSWAKITDKLLEAFAMLGTRPRILPMR